MVSAVEQINIALVMWYVDVEIWNTFFSICIKIGLQSIYETGTSIVLEARSNCNLKAEMGCRKNIVTKFGSEDDR